MAEATGNKDATLNISDPGCTIIITPTNPTITAMNLRMPSFSPRIGTAKTQAIMGAL